MRLPYALAAALAYSFARPDPEAKPAPGAGSEPAIVEPWRPSGIPDAPDPVAEFILTALKVYPGLRVPAGDVLDAFEAWMSSRGEPLPRRTVALARFARYVTVEDIDGRPTFVGLAHRFPAQTTTTTLRAIPALRVRILADATALASEQFSVLQSARDILHAADDEEGPAGDVIRITAAFLDDALADAAAPLSLATAQDRLQAAKADLAAAQLAAYRERA